MRPFFCARQTGPPLLAFPEPVFFQHFLLTWRISLPSLQHEVGRSDRERELQSSQRKASAPGAFFFRSFGRAPPVVFDTAPKECEANRHSWDREKEEDR